MIRKLYYILLSLLFVLLFNIIANIKVYAITPVVTQKVSPTTVAEPSITEEDIKKSLVERLKKAAEQKSEEVGSILGAKDKVAVLGTLADIISDTLTINTDDNSEGMIATDETTTYVRNNKAAKAEDMQIGEFIIAMGYKNDKDILQAKRIVAGNTLPMAPDRLVILGSVSEIDSKKRTLELTEGDNKYEVTVSKKITLDWNKLKDGDRMVVIGQKDKNDAKSLALRAYKIVNFPSPNE